jgi:hypothetical protein
MKCIGRKAYHHKYLLRRDFIVAALSSTSLCIHGIPEPVKRNSKQTMNDTSSSPLKVKRKKRGRAAVNIATKALAKTATTTMAAASLPHHFLAHSSSTNAVIKGLIQQSIEGILLQSALDSLRISSTIFLHRFLMELSSHPTATSVIDSNTAGNVEEERTLLKHMCQLISTHPDYQFLEGTLDERWEEQSVASLGQKKRKSTLLSDIPRASAKQESNRLPPKKTPSSKKSSKTSASSLIPGELATLVETTIVDPPMGEELPVPVAAQPVVWDQEDYD